jgi:hypothetical protein
MNARLQRLYEAVKAHTESDSDELRAMLRDVQRGGADTGWPGFTYTRDCVDFFDANAEDIWALLDEQASDHDLAIPAFIATFGRIDMADTWPGFRSLLAWFALETVAQHRLAVDESVEGGA